MLRHDSALTGIAGTRPRRQGRSNSILGGLYFCAISGDLIRTAVVPLTVNDDWRGPADTIAVGACLQGIVPLLGLALLDPGLIGRGRSEESCMQGSSRCFWQSHTSRRFGMPDPTLLQGAGQHGGMHIEPKPEKKPGPRPGLF